MAFTDKLDDLRECLLGAKPAFRKARALLPPSNEKTTKSRPLDLDVSKVVRGSLVVEGHLVMRPGAALWVLGDLTVHGALYAEALDYSLVVVGGGLHAKVVRTGGEVFALEGLEADTVWGIYNDHSTYAPTLTCDTYITEDRDDVFGKIKARTRVKGGPTPSAALRKLFPDLYPKGWADEDDMTREKRAKGFFVGEPPPKKPGQASAEEMASLREMVRSSDLATKRKAYATIRRKRIVALAPDVAERLRIILANPDSTYSAQDECDLLGALGSDGAEALAKLVRAKLPSTEKWRDFIRNAFEEASWETKAEAGEHAWISFFRKPGAPEWIRIA